MSEIMNNGMNEIGSNGIKGNGTEEMCIRDRQYILRTKSVFKIFKAHITSTSFRK